MVVQLLQEHFNDFLCGFLALFQGVFSKEEIIHIMQEGDAWVLLDVLKHLLTKHFIK